MVSSSRYKDFGVRDTVGICVSTCASHQYMDFLIVLVECITQIYKISINVISMNCAMVPCLLAVLKFEPVRIEGKNMQYTL